MISIENVILPDKPLSNFELEDAVKRLKIPFFRGVILLDALPKRPNKKECGIVNFDKSGGPGTHWVLGIKTVKLKFISIFKAYNSDRSWRVLKKFNILLHRSTTTSGASILSFVFVRSQRTRRRS